MALPGQPDITDLAVAVNAMLLLTGRLVGLSQLLFQLSNTLLKMLVFLPQRFYLLEILLTCFIAKESKHHSVPALTC